MLGFLLFSHGSLLCGSGQALDAHAMRLGERLAPSPVEQGYLNYSEPDVEVALGRLVDRGATKIVIIPYFLVTGYFVKTSLPKRLSEITPFYPGVEVVIADALGVDERLATALASMTSTARAPRIEADEVLTAAAASCRDREDCPLYYSNHCPKGPQSDAAAGWSLQSNEPHGGVDFDAAKSALLVMVHGSPDNSANEPVHQIAEMVRQSAQFKAVQVAFMECNDPTIPDAIDTCVGEGVDAIVAVPYFLHMGTHTTDDLPTTLNDGKSKYPSVEFLMTDYIGLSPLVTDVIYDRAITSAQTTRK